MRQIGLDWGEARIGVAVSDPLGITALPVISLENNGQFFEKLKELIAQYGAEEIVLGLPKQMNGELGIAAEKVKEFSMKLMSEIPVKVTLWDERLTTKIAQGSFRSSGASRKKTKSFIDAAAAGIMLQSFIDSKHK
jgi:putative Holliday junction resolvase